MCESLICERIEEADCSHFIFLPFHKKVKLGCQFFFPSSDFPGGSESTYRGGARARVPRVSKTGTDGSVNKRTNIWNKQHGIFWRFARPPSVPVVESLVKIGTRYFRDSHTYKSSLV